MRFHIGSIPKDSTFQPGFALKQMLAFPVAILISLFLLVCFSLILDNSDSSNQGLITISSSNWWQLPLVMVFFVPLHELLHAVCHPGAGMSNKTIIGIQPKNFSIFTHYEDSMTRTRLLVTVIMPFIVLSIVPIAVLSFFQMSLGMEMVSLLILLSIFNGMASSADIMVFTLVLFQIPNHAITKGHGWKIYWKLES
jgi:hypothetical protein